MPDRTVVHPGMTISVYRVNPTTLERSPAVARLLPAADKPALSHSYPPCACPRCRATR